MPPKVISLSFEAEGYEEVKSFFEKSGATGYVSTSEKKWCAVILDDERVIGEVEHQKFIIGLVKKEKFLHIKTGQFNGLTFIKSKPVFNLKDTIHIDGITPNGLIRGWGVSKSKNLCEVKVWIDGNAIVKFPIDSFRSDLLKEGIGNGCHAFSSRLTDSVLDGREHNVLVELVALGDPDEKTIAKAERYMKLPFHFNLPRPWVGSGKDHAYEWSKENESEYLDIKTSILQGVSKNSIKKAASFIETFPRAIFLDFGIKDGLITKGNSFQGFKYKLRSRWGEQFGRSCCARGDLCCKKVNLPYNNKAIIDKKDVNPIELNTPWEIGGILDRCPMPIRHFASKKLTIDFAHAIGVQVPKTLGYIKSLEDFEGFSFPSRYVLKPDFASGVELYLMSGKLNLFDGFFYSKEDIKSRVGSFLENGGEREFIVEEFVRQEGASHEFPIIPLDYKFHCFGGKARIIHIDDKNTISRDQLHRKQSWLSRDWTHAPASFRSSGEHPNEPIKKPECFKEMLNIADKISDRLRGYIRVDLYASSDGPVLGEITSYSHSGLGFSEYGDFIMGQAWEIFDAA